MLYSVSKLLSMLKHVFSAILRESLICEYTRGLFRGTSYLLSSRLIKQLNYASENWLFALISSNAQILPYHFLATTQLLLGRVSFYTSCNKKISRTTLVSDSHKACFWHCSYKASSDLGRHRCFVDPLLPCFTHPTALNQSQHAARRLGYFPAT